MSNSATFSESVCACYINGVQVELEPNTLDCTNTIGQRSQTTFDFHEFTGVLYPDGAQIKIYDPTSVLIYSGFVDSDVVTWQGTTPPSFYHSVQCRDNQYYAERLYVAESYAAGVTAGAIVNDLWNKYLSTEGVTIGGIATGLVLPAVIYNYRQLSQVLSALAKFCSYWWNIDQLGRLWFQPYTGVPAPWVYDGTQSDNSPSNKPTLSSGNPEYRNRQYAIGGYDETGLLTESFTGDGQRKAFTLRYPVSSSLAITVAGAAQSIGTKGATGQNFYYAVGDAVVAQDDSQSAPGSGVAVSVTYKGRYPVVALAQSNSQIVQQRTIEGGGTGYVESVYRDSKLYTLSAAFQTASAQLAHFGQPIKTLKFRTAQSGLQEGQLLTVNFPAFCGLQQQMLVQTVEIKEDNETIWWNVTALGSPVDVTWQSFFQALVGETDNVDPANLSDDQALAILVAGSGNETCAGTGTITTRTPLIIPFTVSPTAIIG